MGNIGGTYRSLDHQTTTKPVVIITGCSEGGIGYELAKKFNAENCTVYATARRHSSMGGLPELGINTEELDVTSLPSIKETVSRIMSRERRINILVNNAGVSVWGPVAELPVEKVRQVFDANYFGAISLIQEVFPHMAAQKSGRIVNVGSVASYVHMPYKYAYCSSKIAMRAASNAMRVEMKPFGIKVMLVEPGYVGTNIYKTTADTTNSILDTSSSSLYKPFEKKAVSEFTKKHKMTPVRDFAATVVTKTLSKSPPWRLLCGKQSNVAVFLSVLPQGFIDWVLAKKFGFNT